MKRGITNIALFPSGLNIRFPRYFADLRQRFEIDPIKSISILVGFSLMFAAVFAYRRIACEVADELIQSLTDF